MFRALFQALRRLTDFLIYSNLFIAICALGFVWATYRTLGVPVRWDALSGLSFCATLGLYLALRIHAARKQNEQAPLLLWVNRNRLLAYALLLFGLFGACYYAFQLDAQVWLALAPAGLLSFAYGLPFLPVPARYRLRHRNYLKIFLIAGVWAWMSVILPVSYLGAEISKHSLWQDLVPLFFSRFLFVLGITLPFDIRDIESDRVYHLETIPMAIGVGPSILLARLCLITSLALLLPPTLLGDPFEMQSWMLYALLPLYLGTIWLVSFSRKTSNPYLYLGLLDGTMLGHWLHLEVWLYFFGA